MGYDILIEVAGIVLLFLLVFGMSATVDIKSLSSQLKNSRAILSGCVLQFIILPFLGFIVVKSLNLNETMGISLLVLTSSPGGSYSNWFSSMFNADLALSVTMTAISTLLSIFTLPINLLLYSNLCYDDDVIAQLDWIALFISLMVVIGAIVSGLVCSAKVHSHKFNMIANKLGNIAGVLLVIFSLAISNTGGADSKIWNRPWHFYIGIALPCVLGLFIANIFTTFLRLRKPERVTVSIECCYQNVGIATSVALTMFDGDDLAEAMGVPLYYGLLEALILGLYCIVAWKVGWTKAPPNVSFCKMLLNSYEVLLAEKAEEELGSVEIIISDDGDNAEKLSENNQVFAYFKLDDKRKEPSGLDLEIPRHLDDDDTTSTYSST